MKLTLWVETEPGTVMKDLEFFIRGMSASFTIKIDEETDEVYGHVNRLERGDVEVVTEDSSVDANTISQVMSFVLDSLRTPLNNLAKEQKFKIPTDISVFQLSDLELTYHEGYIEAGLTPTFLAPETPFVPQIPDAVPSDDFAYQETLDASAYDARPINDVTVWEIFAK